MKTDSKSLLNRLTAGCVLAVLLFHSAGSARGGIEETFDKTISSGGTPATATTTQNDIAGTWHLSIHYTGRDDAQAEGQEGTRPGGPRRVSGNVKGKDASSGITATNNVGAWITARFISFRVVEPRPGNLTFMLKQEGEKVTGTYSAPGSRQKVSGTVKGKDVSFSAAVTNNTGEQITARFTGEVLSSSKMEGIVTFDLKSAFNGTGTRRPAKLDRHGQSE